MVPSQGPYPGHVTPCFFLSPQAARSLLTVIHVSQSTWHAVRLSAGLSVLPEGRSGSADV